MARSKSRRLSRRQKVVLSIVLSVIGTVAMIGVGVAVQSARDTDLGDSQAGLTDRFQAAGGRSAPPIRFLDVAASMGLVEVHASGPRGRTLPEDTGSGLAWSDFDGDGDPDLYVVGYDPLNEPWPGNPIKDISLLKPGHMDKKYLAPMYANIFDKYQTHDTTK